MARTRTMTIPAALTGALPELRTAYAGLDMFARSHGISIGIADFGGVRTQADTTLILGYRDADYAVAQRVGEIQPDTTLQQFRPIKAFGTSWHNYGAAFDVVIVSRPAGMSEYEAQKQLGSYAPTLGLRWGGRFGNPDPPHFELAITLNEAKSRYAAMTGQPAAGTFDISRLVPFLAPDDEDAASDDGGGVFGFDDAGTLAPMPSDGYIILGLFVFGVVAFAIHHSRTH